MSGNVNLASGELSPELLAYLQNVPALNPPPGVEPNFRNPRNQNQPFIVVTSILFAVAVLLFFNRVYYKVFLLKKYYWDDLTVSLAVIGSIAYYVACVWGARHELLGVHQWDLSVVDVMSLHLLIPSYLITVLTPPTFLFMKVTFFFMYLLLFKPMRWLKICAYLGCVVTTLFYSAMTICQFIFATPGRNESWISHVSTTNQQRALSLSVPQSAVGLGIDLYILILPIIAISKLQLAFRRKMGLILLFMTGVMACIASLLSIYYRHILNVDPDTTWVLMPVNTVTLTEMFVGIICACVPATAHTLRQSIPVYQNLKSKITSKFGSSNDPISDNYNGDGSSRPKQGIIEDKDNLFLSPRSKRLRRFIPMSLSQSLFATNTDTVSTNVHANTVNSDDRYPLTNNGIQLTYQLHTTTGPR